MVVVGTRPEAIKLLPVVSALRAAGVPTRVCATAQHRELLDRVLGPECMTPDIDLNLMRPNQRLTDLAGEMLLALGRTFEAERPDRVIIQGDTATALAGAQAAYFSSIPVAHVEAGLRSGDLANPHPEEGNRRAIAAFADLHFAPTRAAARALMSEGIPAASVHMAGNTVVDSLLAAQQHLAVHGPRPEITSLLAGLEGRRLVIVTCHRRENIDRLGHILSAITTIGSRPDVLVVIPMHPNSAVRAPIIAALAGRPGVALIEPLDFLPFVTLLSAAHFVLTDSGGVQEEAPVLGVPVLVMRNTTERPEGVDAGTAVLVGTDPGEIVRQATRLLDNPFAHARMARKHSPYGDGRAAGRIAHVIAVRHGYAGAAAKLLA